MELKQQAVQSEDDLKIQLKMLTVSIVSRKDFRCNYYILTTIQCASQRYIRTYVLCFSLQLFYIQTTLEDFQKVLTDEQKSRKTLDASIKALTVSLCITTYCKLHIL